jgi:hypothetical protein
MDNKTEKLLDNIMERQEDFKNELANVIRIADNIQSVTRDYLQGHASKFQCRNEIIKYANEIIKRVSY